MNVDDEDPFDLTAWSKTVEGVLEDVIRSAAAPYLPTAISFPKASYEYETADDVEVDGVLLKRVHWLPDCDTSVPCIVHNQTEHHMRKWKLTVTHVDGVLIFLRICPLHGQPHLDPDQIQYLHKTYGEESDLTSHSCVCRCCDPDQPL